MARPVYVVHCVDTEGPLHELVEATFERLKAIFGIDLEPSVALLRQLQAGEVDLGGIEQAVRKVVDPHLLDYNDTWDKVDGMLASCMSPAFREQTVDSEGNGWVYNWFCVDHVDYDLNPRRRDIGYHNVFDHYQSVIRETGSPQDGVQFHYHPHNFRREANHCATHWWASSDSLAQVLCRRVIDRRWFPAAHRAGLPRHPAGQPLVPGAAHPVRPLQPGRRRGGRRLRPIGPGRRPLGGLAPCPRHLGALPPGPRRLPGARVVPPLDRPLSQHRNPLPPPERGARAAGVRRGGGGPASRPGLHQPRLPRHAPRHRRRAGPADPGGTRVSRRSVPVQRGPHRHARGAAAPGAARLRARGHALPRPARPPTSSRSGRRSRPSGRSRGWPCAPSPARITTTTSTSTSRSTAGATSSTRRPSRSARSTPSAWRPTTPTA